MLREEKKRKENGNNILNIGLILRGKKIGRKKKKIFAKLNILSDKEHTTPPERAKSTIKRVIQSPQVNDKLRILFSTTNNEMVIARCLPNNEKPHSS